MLSHITIVETMESSESGMNPFAMTVINHQKNIGRAGDLNQRLLVLKSSMLPTEQRGPSALAGKTSQEQRYTHYVSAVVV